MPFNFCLHSLIYESRFWISWMDFLLSLFFIIRRNLYALIVIYYYDNVGNFQWKWNINSNGMKLLKNIKKKKITITHFRIKNGCFHFLRVKRSSRRTFCLFFFLLRTILVQFKCKWFRFARNLDEDFIGYCVSYTCCFYLTCTMMIRLMHFIRPT